MPRRIPNSNRFSGAEVASGVWLFVACSSYDDVTMEFMKNDTVGAGGDDLNALATGG
jgi:hypothetical protein